MRCFIATVIADCLIYHTFFLPAPQYWWRCKKKLQGLVSRQDLTILTYSSPHLGNDFLFRVCLVSLDWIDWFIICHMALLTLVISAMLATASGKVTPWQHIDFLPPVIAPPCNRSLFISWDLSDASQRATYSLWGQILCRHHRTPCPWFSCKTLAVSDVW